MGAFLVTFRDGRTVSYLLHATWDSFFAMDTGR